MFDGSPELLNACQVANRLRVPVPFVIPVLAYEVNPIGIITHADGSGCSAYWSEGQLEEIKAALLKHLGIEQPFP